MRVNTRLRLLCLMIWAGLLGLLSAAATAAEPHPGENYRRFTHDGAWCWFSDPRAIHRSGRTYAGWVNTQGDIVVGVLSDQAEPIQTTILHRRLERNDHANPSLVFLLDSRLRAFYSKHTDSGIRTRVTNRPEDITSW